MHSFDDLFPAAGHYDSTFFTQFAEKLVGGGTFLTGNKLVVPARTPRIKVTDAYILNGTWNRGRDIYKYPYYSEMRKGWHSDLTVTLQ